MDNFAETSVNSMKRAILFWVIKNVETGKYLGTDNDWVDKLEDAEAIAEDTLEERLDFAYDNYDLSSFGQDAIDKQIASEKSFWEEEYDSQPKDKYGLIDNWNLKYQVHDIIKAIPIYARQFHETRSDLQKQIDLMTLDLIDADMQKMVLDIKRMSRKFKPEDGPIRYIAGGKIFDTAQEAADYQQELFRRNRA